jgi:hypothetical protein
MCVKLVTDPGAAMGIGTHAPPATELSQPHWSCEEHDPQSW